MSVSYVSLLAMIPSEISRNSELLNMLRKLRAYIRILVVLWFLVFAAFCMLAGGGAIFILVQYSYQCFYRYCSSIWICPAINCPDCLGRFRRQNMSGRKVN